MKTHCIQSSSFLTFKYFFMTTSFFKPAWIKSLALCIVFFSGFSTISKAGGIVFEIYLNNKLLLKQAYNKVVSGSPDLQFTTANYNDNLRIVFTACGASSKTRSVGIKNENGEVVKKWDFVNSAASDLSMSIPVKEILALQKNKSNASLKLFYFSPDQFQDGFQLASLQPGKKELTILSDPKVKYIPIVTAGICALGLLGLVARRKI